MGDRNPICSGGHPVPNFVRAAIVLAIAVLPAAAVAQDPQATQAEARVVSRVVDALCVDVLRATAGCEMAILLQSETLDQMADLLLRTGDGANLIVARGLVFSGGFEAQRPSLEGGHGRTLLIRSEQFAVGRTPWTKTLTVREMDGVLHVVGYVHTLLDRPMGGDFSCSVDLETGAWHASAVRVDPDSGDTIRVWDEQGTSAPDATPLIHWGRREPPAQCDPVMLEWFNASP